MTSASQAELIYFSPTGTTKKILNAIAKGMNCKTVSTVDLTLPEAVHQPATTPNTLTIIGIPVYAGRIAPPAKERLQQYIKGYGRKVVLVAVYGNRAFEDALLELRILARKIGFEPFAAAAFIGEHSFSTTEKPIAPHRPDTKDIDIAQQFGEQVLKKLHSSEKSDSELFVPGNFPHRDGMQPSQITPEVSDACTKCGECSSVCPTAAIPIENPSRTNAELCIKCCACIRICPENARELKAEGITKIQEFLFTQHSDRKQPDFFL